MLLLVLFPMQLDTKLIYTYKTGLHHIPEPITTHQIILIYRECIINNNKFHKSKMYTTSDCVHLFEDIVDEIEIIDETYDVFFQDDLKFYVLQNETAPFTIIDGDIILDNKLITTNEDVVYEKLIKDNPNDDYFLKMRQYLIDYNIESHLPYWKNYDCTYNLGIVHVNDISFVSGFIKEYTKLKDWYIKTIESVNSNLKNNVVIEMATCTYFLSMYLMLNNKSIGILNNTNSFTHYSGLNQKLELLKKIGKHNLI